MLFWSIVFSCRRTRTRSWGAACRNRKSALPIGSQRADWFPISRSFSMSTSHTDWIGLMRAASGTGSKVDDDFHEKVGNAFRQFADPKWQRSHPECGPIQLIDGAGDEATVQERVVSALMAAFPQPFGSIKS